MLMQSNLGYIELLPALPAEWSSGEISGIVARGNFEISMQWKDCKLTKVSLKSRNGGVCVMKLVTTNVSITDSQGNQISHKVENGKVIFDTMFL